MSQITFRNISKSYGKKQPVIRDFSTTVPDGSFVVIIGPSGCGKSTLLRMVAGLEEVGSGEIIVDGQVINNLEPRERAMSMVFQDYALYPHMTVRENLAFNLKIKKTPKVEIEQAISSIASRLEIQELLDRKPSELSGGQKQRVALGRALVKNPRVLLMDEPLSNLDAKLRMQMRVEIVMLHKERQCTVLYVTHDQAEAMTMADMIIVMNKGDIQQTGNPDEIYNRPANLFVAQFVGNIAINLFTPAELRQLLDSSSQPGAGRTLDVGRDGVVYAVRPENLRLVPGDAYRVRIGENYGNEQVAYLESCTGGADTLIRVRVPLDQPVSPGQNCALAVTSLDKVLVFDAGTEKLLAVGVDHALL